MSKSMYGVSFFSSTWRPNGFLLQVSCPRHTRSQKSLVYQSSRQRRFLVSSTRRILSLLLARVEDSRPDQETSLTKQSSLTDPATIICCRVETTSNLSQSMTAGGKGCRSCRSWKVPTKLMGGRALLLLESC